MLLRRTIPLPPPPPFVLFSDAPGDLLEGYTATPGGSCAAGPVTIGHTGGAAPFTISWPPAIGGITCGSPSSFTTSFGYTGHGLASYESHIFTATVHDNSGKVGYISILVRCQAGGAPP